MKKLCIALLLAGSTACGLFNSVINGAEDSAGTNLGNRLGNRIVNESAPPGAGGQVGGMGAMNPAMMNMYMGVIFAYAFSSGGYDVTTVPYKPGDYTRWTGKSDDGKKIVLERAYLGDDPKGRKWWKVKWTDDEQKTVTLEGLLDPKANRFVRMRAKFPEDTEGKEMPVDEGTYYHPPQKLSEDSIEGATKGVENVTVPAGSFKAKHVVFGGLDGTHEWWIDSKVPGGTVKQSLRSPKDKDEKSRWDMDLAAYGSDAKSELGSK